MEPKILITSEWCGSCREAKRKYDELGVKYREVQYDSEEGEKLVDMHNIRRIPALILEDQLIVGIPEQKDVVKLTEDAILE